MGKTTVYLPDELLNALERRTKEDDIKKSQLVQRALKKYFETEQNEGEDTINIRQDQLEDKVENLENVQEALLEKLKLRIKNKPEPEEIDEDEIVLVGDDEDEDEDEE